MELIKKMLEEALEKIKAGQLKAALDLSMMVSKCLRDHIKAVKLAKDPDKPETHTN